MDAWVWWVLFLIIIVFIMVKTKKSETTDNGEKRQFIRNTYNNERKEIFKLLRYSDSKYSKVVAFDLETTGLSADRDEIIEIGAIKIDLETGEQSRFNRLIKPKRKLSKEIISITGISDEMLLGGVNIKDALTDFLIFIGDLPLVAHNAKFDAEFLTSSLGKNLGVLSFENLFIDSIAQLKQHMKRLDSYKLKDVVESLGIDANPNHRAINDADAVAKVYKLTYEKYLEAKREAEKTKEMYDFVMGNQDIVKCMYYVLRIDGKLLAKERPVALDYLIKEFGEKSFFDDDFIKSYFCNNDAVPSPNNFLKSLKAIENKNSFLEFAEQILTIKKKPSELEISTLELIKKTIQSPVS